MVKSFNIEEAGIYIEHYLDLKNPNGLLKRSLMIHGGPGIGKSKKVEQIVRAYAAFRGKKFSFTEIGPGIVTLIDLRGSQIEPPDLRGYPFPNGDVVKNLLPGFLPRAEQGGEGVIFCDEINQSDDSVQKAMMQLINDKRVGDWVLPDGWCIIAAGNRQEDGATINPMSSPLNNRFAHITVHHDLKVWVDWANKNDVDAEITSFLVSMEAMDKDKNYLYMLSKSKKEPAYPTPRSWAALSDSIKRWKENHNGELKPEDAYNLALFEVGHGVAAEFEEHLVEGKKINIDVFLKNPKKYHELDKLSHKYNLATKIQGKYKNDAKKNIDAIMSLLFEMEDEIAVYVIKLLKEHDEGKFNGIMLGSKHIDKFMEKYEKYFQHLSAKH